MFLGGNQRIQRKLQFNSVWFFYFNLSSSATSYLLIWSCPPSKHKVQCLVWKHTWLTQTWMWSRSRIEGDIIVYSILYNIIRGRKSSTLPSPTLDQVDLDLIPQGTHTEWEALILIALHWIESNRIESNRTESSRVKSNRISFIQVGLHEFDSVSALRLLVQLFSWNSSLSLSFSVFDAIWCSVMKTDGSNLKLRGTMSFRYTYVGHWASTH